MSSNQSHIGEKRTLARSTLEQLEVPPAKLGDAQSFAVEVVAHEKYSRTWTVALAGYDRHLNVQSDTFLNSDQEAPAQQNADDSEIKHPIHAESHEDAPDDIISSHIIEQHLKATLRGLEAEAEESREERSEGGDEEHYPNVIRVEGQAPTGPQVATWILDKNHEEAQEEKPPEVRPGSIKLDVFAARLGYQVKEEVPTTRRGREENPFLGYFLPCFPPIIASDIINNTNMSIRSGVRRIDHQELFAFFGACVLYGASQGRSLSTVCPTSSDGEDVIKLEYNQRLPYPRIKEIRASLAILPVKHPNIWAPFQDILIKFNLHNRDLIAPGTFLVVDEECIAWHGKKDEPENERAAPKIMKFINKPVTFGAQVRTMADASTGFLLSALFQTRCLQLAGIPRERLEDATITKEVKMYYIVMALLLQAQQENKGAIVIADSLFASVRLCRRLLGRGTYFVGPVKSSHAYYPKACMTNMNIQRGEWVTYKAKSDGGPIYAVAHTRDFCDMYVSSVSCAGRAVNASDSRLDRERYPKVPWADDAYVTHKGVIDHINQLHQIVPITEVRTESFTTKFILYILSICTLNSYKAYRFDHRDSDAEPMNYVEYCKRLVKGMQENTVYAQQPLPLVMDDAHVNRLLPSFYAPRGLTVDIDCVITSGEGPVDRHQPAGGPGDQGQHHERSRTLRDCSICGRRTSSYCATCSNREGKRIPVCSTISHRPCAMSHASTVAFEKRGIKLNCRQID